MTWLRSDRAGVVWSLTAAAIALRLVMFLGRGDYVAFDEGWYLLLGRNLLAGEGYTLSGLRHVALSPLFPMLAGAADVVLNDIVWSGRLVAAVAGGLLVVPCWSIAMHLGGRRAALIACAFVVVMPALAPFVVPYWIGWDLWVGAEPLLHFLLFSAIALMLRAYVRRSGWMWLAAGGLYGLAYLARAEAIIVLGVTGLLLGVLALLRLDWRRFGYAAVLGVGFIVAAAPYWSYLHDTLGRWTITGRSIELAPREAAAEDRAGPGDVGAAVAIETMLWSGDRTEYIRRLYALDATGTRLGNTYWGVPVHAQQPSQPFQPAVSDPMQSDVASRGPAPTETAADGAPSPPRSRVLLYFRAVGLIIPWFMWPFILAGLPVRRRGWEMELLVALPLLATSLAVAHVVAADPRTQAFILPLVGFYAARGVRRVGVSVGRRRTVGTIRQGFATQVLVASLLVVLLGTQARRLYMSLAVGSPHHLVGAENRRIGEALRDALPPDEPVMSWHPAIALFAGRDWRVLPQAEFEAVVRYANAIGSTNIVLSAYYPSPLPMEAVPGQYLVLHVPPAPAGTREWRLRVTEDLAGYVTATVEPATP